MYKNVNVRRKNGSPTGRYPENCFNPYKDWFIPTERTRDELLRSTKPINRELEIPIANTVIIDY